MAKIGIFGAGYVGLVSGVCFAELGHSVVVRDIVPEKIDALRRGEPPIHESGLGDLLERNGERLRFTLDAGELADRELLFVCVDTPPTYSGDADLSRVWSVLDDLPKVAPESRLVMKSTVPVGTGEKVRAALDARGLEQVGYVSNPEFLAEGTAVEDFMHPDRIVIGAFEEADADAVEAVHAGIDAPIVRTDVASSEMIKLASNAFLSTRISFINEIANVCELVGADVDQVAKGIGLDHRLGPHYLRAGIGWGGSCLAGQETVLVRRGNRTWLTPLARLYGELDGGDDGVVRPTGLEVLAWQEGATPRFFSVAALTRREFEGDVLEVHTKMGRRVRCTPDHPFVVSSADGVKREIKLASELTERDWLPVAQHHAAPVRRNGAGRSFDLLEGLPAAGITPDALLVRPQSGILDGLGLAALKVGTASHSRGAARAYDIARTGTLRLDEARRLGLGEARASVGTATNGTYVPSRIDADARFWRVVGLYVAEGHCSQDGERRRLQWSFHPDDEADLVEEVAGYWQGLGVKADVRRMATAMAVTVSSRALAGWWLGPLGLGANCYQQRLPDAIWNAPAEHQRALLSALWRGDGSWSFVRGGPSVVLEYGTVSRELADGLLRLLGGLGVVARVKMGRTAKSTCDTFWLIISGADQVERLLDLVAAGDRPRIRRSLRRQVKRIAPTGYRRFSPGAGWVRVREIRRRPFKGFVYSLEVPDAHTFVTTGGLITHNCFPKDVSALRQLAGNSGYHFHLLSAVWEVNELQKRRVIGKLQKHLGNLRGRTVALLGLAFKAGTDDLREAPSLVIASRLLAEGADVRAWDPVADAREVLQGVTFCETPLEAARGADAAVIVTEWPELKELALDELARVMSGRLVIDGRNLLDPDAVRGAGLAYEGIGRPSSPFAALPETAEREPEPRL